MLNQTTEMSYASLKKPSGVNTLLQKMRFKKRVESGVFAENCVQKDSAVWASRNLCVMLFISLESPWRERLNSSFHFKIGSRVFWVMASWTRHEIVKKSRYHKVLRAIGAPYFYLKNGSFEFEVDHHQFNVRLHHFHNFLSMLKKINKSFPCGVSERQNSYFTTFRLT